MDENGVEFIVSRLPRLAERTDAQDTAAETLPQSQSQSQPQPQAQPRKPRIVVVGSCNTDLISYVDCFPRPGETVRGHKFSTGCGGKGANQAVAAAKLCLPTERAPDSRLVHFVGCVGKDFFGDQFRAEFARCGVGTEFLATSSCGNPTGVAPIFVDKDGANAIVIVAGANDEVAGPFPDAAVECIASATVLVCQNEIPLEAGTLEAMRCAKRAGALVIFNPAPAPPALPDGVLSLCDVFCPNESEAEALSGVRVCSVDSGFEAARSFVSQGAESVVLTLGERGAVVVTRSESCHVPAEAVHAIDTTGAGDSFIGSMAYFLAHGAALRDAVSRASVLASLSVQRPGTQCSFPSRDECPQAFFA